MQFIFIILNAWATYSSNGREKNALTEMTALEVRSSLFPPPSSPEHKMLWTADEKMRLDIKTPGLRLNTDPI